MADDSIQLQHELGFNELPEHYCADAPTIEPARDRTSSPTM